MAPLRHLIMYLYYLQGNISMKFQVEINVTCTYTYLHVFQLQGCWNLRMSGRARSKGGDINFKGKYLFWSNFAKFSAKVGGQLPPCPSGSNTPGLGFKNELLLFKFLIISYGAFLIIHTVCKTNFYQTNTNFSQTKES